MRILALETAGRACSVALGLGAAVIEHVDSRPRQQAASILPLVGRCLAEARMELAGLDGIAFGRGPGSFTGVRIAASVAQGLAFGAGLAVAPVSSLAAAAAAARRKHGWTRVLVANDARMDEAYAAAYDSGADGLPRALGPERVLAPSELERPGGGEWYGAGNAYFAWPELGTRLGLAGVDPALEPSARDLLGLAARLFAEGAGVAPEAALPVYLREQVAWKGGGR